MRSSNRAFVFLLLVPACKPDPGPCIPDVVPGSTLDVTVQERLSAQNSDVDPITKLPSCHLDDVTVGTTHSLKLGADQTNNDECVTPSCPSDFPSPSTPYEVSPPPLGLNYVCYSHQQQVAVQNCQARRIVGIPYFVKHTEVFDPPDGGVRYPVVMTRMLVRSESDRLSCPSHEFRTCSDSYAVTLDEPSSGRKHKPTDSR